jgi:hypothetical protein
MHISFGIDNIMEGDLMKDRNVRVDGRMRIK